MPTARAAARSKMSKGLMNDFALDDVHNHRINRHTFTIYVGGDPLAETEDGSEPGVEHHMADRFERNLDLLSSIDPTKPIRIVMSTCGGGWEDGMQMFGAILACPNPVTVIGTKWNRSMSSIVPLAADRFLMRHPTRYMIHRGDWMEEGTDQEAETNDIERRKVGEMMLRIYTARLREQGCYTRWSEERIRAMLSRQFEKHIDVWLSVDEAVHKGFCDGAYTGQSDFLAPKRDIGRRNRILAAITRPITVTVTVR